MRLRNSSSILAAGNRAAFRRRSAALRSRSISSRSSRKGRKAIRARLAKAAPAVANEIDATLSKLQVDLTSAFVEAEASAAESLQAALSS